MPTDISRAETVALMEAGAQVVDVLPRKEFEEEHLPGAISIPLRHIDERAPELLDPARPVVVYCFDFG